MSDSVVGGHVRTLSACIVLVAVLSLAFGTVGVAIASGSAAEDPGTIGPDVAHASDSASADTARDNASETRALVVLEPADVSPAMAPDEIESRLKTHAGSLQPQVRAQLEPMGVTVENRFWIVNALVVTFDGTAVTATQLEAVDGVREVTRTPQIEPPESITPEGSTPTRADQTYGLEQIDAPAVWDTYNTTGAGATIVIQDDGFDTDHEALNFEEAWKIDGTGQKAGPPASSAHGTHVAGTATGSNDSNGTAIGVAPAAELHGHDIFSANGGDPAGIVEASIGSMQIAVQEDADVVSGSWGYGCLYDGHRPYYVDALIDVINNTRLLGTEVVASSGNAGEGCVGGFGNEHGSFSIGASNESRGIAEFRSGESSGGLIDKIDGQPNWPKVGSWSNPPADWPRSWVAPRVVAPGANVYSSEPGDSYGQKSGTSMSAPHVAGSIALMQAATHRDYTGPELREALVATAQKPDNWTESSARWTNNDSTMAQQGIDSRYGHGIIDVKAAVDLLRPARYFNTTIASANSSVTEGETVTVDGRIENFGNQTATQSINLTIDGAVVNGTTATIGPANSSEVSIQWQTGANDAGNYTVALRSADDSDSSAVSVESPTLGYYANESGFVEHSGVVDALGDWRAGIVDTLLLLDVVDAWQSDTCVECS